MSFGLNIKTIFNLADEEENKNNQENEPNMVLYAVPSNTPIIISADKLEEFLNIKPNEELIEKHKKRLEKYKHIITDNTKKDVNKE